MNAYCHTIHEFIYSISREFSSMGQDEARLTKRQPSVDSRRQINEKNKHDGGQVNGKKRTETDLMDNALLRVVDRRDGLYIS